MGTTFAERGDRLLGQRTFGQQRLPPVDQRCELRDIRVPRRKAGQQRLPLRPVAAILRKAIAPPGVVAAVLALFFLVSNFSCLCVIHLQRCLTSL